ncbi:MAG: hypothetical protein KGL35_03330 [Bradyrhizobium sp.]|nr:hypothetical protein [Bradyrhizobium sp.]
MIDTDIGNTAIALAHAQREARENAQDERDAQLLAEGRELLHTFPRVATPAMLHRLLDLGDEATGISTDDLLRFLLDEFRAGSLRARVLLGRFWEVAKDYPELLPEPHQELVRAKFLSDYVEQLR